MKAWFLFPLTHYLNACFKASHVCELTHSFIAADAVNVGPRSKIWYGSLVTRILSGTALCSHVLYLILMSCLFSVKHLDTGTAVAQWLRCFATNRKVADSIPASVSGFFIDIKPFRSHYGPGVDSASNRNEYQEYFLGVKAAGTYGWQPYHHPVPLSWNLGTLTSWNLLGHCGTNRKVAGSIPAGVIGIFYWHKILPIALWPWGRLSL